MNYPFFLDSEAEQEVADLRAALEFYARGPTFRILPQKRGQPVADHGERARDALARPSILTPERTGGE